MSGKKKHILVIRLSAMGDVAMTVPVLRALVAQHPKVRVTVVSRESYSPFFAGIPRVEFYAAQVDGKHKSFFGLLRLYNELKKLKVNAVADLHNVLRSKIITTLFRVLRGKKTATVDKARDEKAALTRAKDKVFQPLMPMVQRHADVFGRLGFPVNLDQPVFPAKPELPPNIEMLTGEKKGYWIGIAPFAQHRSKIYPPDLMHKVVDLLAANSSNKLFLFGGGKTESDVLNRFAGDHENVFNMAGKGTLANELKLISHLDVMLSMDSGNAHIGAMLGVQVVTLWGATHPYAGYAPFNQPLSNALVSDRKKYPMLPTSVYGNKKVEGYENAMRTIPPEAVVAKIDEVQKK